MRAHFLELLLTQPAGSQTTLLIEGQASPLASTVEAAFDSRSRKRGLLGRDDLARDAAMIIAPCGAVHTIGMRFPIDVIFADRDGRVLKIAPAVAPRRVVVCFGAFAVVEMAGGEAHRHGLNIGDRLSVGRSATA